MWQYESRCCIIYILDHDVFRHQWYPRSMDIQYEFNTYIRTWSITSLTRSLDKDTVAKLGVDVAPWALTNLEKSMGETWRKHETEILRMTRTNQFKESKRSNQNGGHDFSFSRYVFFISTRCFDRWHAILVFYFVPLNHSHISNRPSPSPIEDLSARIKNLEVRIRAGEKDEADTKTKTQVLPLSRVHPLFCVPRIFIFILEKKKKQQWDIRRASSWVSPKLLVGVDVELLSSSWSSWNRYRTRMQDVRAWVFPDNVQHRQHLRSYTN